MSFDGGVVDIEHLEKLGKGSSEIAIEAKE